MVYHFKVHKEGSGFWADCLELDGCRTQADSLAELKTRMAEALDLYLREPEDSDVSFPEPREAKGRNIVAVPVEPSLGLSIAVRAARRRHKLSQREAAAKLGFKNLYSYQRLENARMNPELKTLALIKSAFPEISLDEVLSATPWRAPTRQRMVRSKRRNASKTLSA